MVDFGEDIRINDRFFIGGDSLRGFENPGLVRVVTGTDDALGGQSYAVGTVELSFPVGIAERTWLYWGALHRFRYVDQSVEDDQF